MDRLTLKASASSSTQPKLAPLPPTPPSELDAEAFSCRICLDTPTEPVVTPCGHLSCWKCIHPWLAMHRFAPSCPVCKAPCSTDSVIPVYGCGREEKDPRAMPLPKPPRVKAKSGQSSSSSSRSNWVRTLTPPSPWVIRPELCSLPRPDIPNILTAPFVRSIQATRPTSSSRRPRRSHSSFKLPSRW